MGKEEESWCFFVYTRRRHRLKAVDVTGLMRNLSANFSLFYVFCLHWRNADIGIVRSDEYEIWRCSTNGGQRGNTR